VKSDTAKPSVRDLRLKAILTQEELAERVGLSRATVQAIEAGRHVPTPLTQERLAQFFGVARSDLFPEPEKVA
jgi:putative transcriptional regulator